MTSEFCILGAPQWSIVVTTVGFIENVPGLVDCFCNRLQCEHENLQILFSAHGATCFVMRSE